VMTEIFPAYGKLPWIQFRFSDPVIHQYYRPCRPEDLFYAARDGHPSFIV
jgi:hypothetical protein